MLLHRATTESRSALAAELRRRNTVRVSVGTSSMLPGIREGDSLTISPVSQTDLARGNIVLVSHENEWIVHRLVALRETKQGLHAFTRGDNADRLDRPSPVADILGRVTAVCSDGRTAPPPQVPATIGIDEVLLLSSFSAADAVADLETLTMGIPQDVFVKAAMKEGLGELVYYHNRSTCNAQEVLKKAHVATLGRNTLFLDKLQEITRTLAGIDFIVLKGAMLAARVYPSPALRRFSDIDILIRNDNLPKVEKKIHDLGYRKSGPAESFPSPASGPYLNSVTWRIWNGPSLHVHWHLLNSILPKYVSSTVNMDEIWSEAIATDNGWMSLCPEHLVLHLSEHAVRHSFSRLILLRDIAEVIEKYADVIDWQRLRDCAERYGLAHPLYYGILFLARRTPCVVKNDIARYLRPRRLGHGENLFMQLALNGKRRPELCNMAYMGAAGTARNKCRFLFRSLFPPREVLAHAYAKNPDEIGVNDYAARLWRGTRQAARMLQYTRRS